MEVQRNANGGSKLKAYEFRAHACLKGVTQLMRLSYSQPAAAPAGGEYAPSDPCQFNLKEFAPTNKL